MNRVKHNNTLILESHSTEKNNEISNFELKSLAELDGPLKRKVINIVNNTSPTANVVGVLLNPQLWDIRPFVRMPNEKEIYVIRLLSTDISAANALKEELIDSFEQLTKFDRPINSLREWGVYANQIWYRRVLVERTFEDILLDEGDISFNEYLALSSQIAEEISKWHSQGFVHGHINYRNIGVSTDNKIYLLDHKVGEFSLRAINIFHRPLNFGYDKYIIAPEVLAGNSATTASDCFGFATLCRMLSAKISQKQYNEKVGAALRLINVLLSQMKNQEPDSRSTLAEYISLMENINEMVRAADIPADSEKVALQGISKAGSTQQNLPVASTRPRVQKTKPTIDTRIFASKNMSSKFKPPLPELAKSGNEASNVQLKADLDYVLAKHIPILKRPKNVSLGLFIGILVFIGITIAGISVYYQRYSLKNFATNKYTFQELQSYWASELPGKMIDVLKTIVTPKGLNQDAEQIVVASVLKEENKLPELDTNLIKVAYSPIWGRNALSNEEKRLLFVLATKRIFGNELMGTISFEKPSPVVLFAMIYSFGNMQDNLLKQYPVSDLYVLPDPVGSAFAKLGEDYPNSTLGDTVVKDLVRVLSTEGSDGLALDSYLATDTQLRLIILGLATSKNSQIANKILTNIINNPNYLVKNELANWGRQAELTNMSELTPTQKIYLLAGLLDSKVILNPESIGKLFTHPIAKIRQKTLGKALETVKFVHPAAKEVLTFVKDNPKLLDGMQTLRLAQFMENPNPKAGNRVVQEWLNTTIDNNLLIKIVLAGAEKGEKGTIVDFEICRFLQSEGWIPSVANIKKLIKSPDRYTRLFAYTETSRTDNKQEAIAILERAAKIEKDPDFKKVIENNLKILKK
ncbi:MAG: protein kinase [Deltaproteobacteria bacterium]|nr:protein kinase [Deltaproteobacteria bacterium]